jgi:ubiquinone/menaquinone biosynthesis C-methylase UbiE
MSDPRDFWNRRLKNIDPENYDFSERNHEKALESFCNKYLKKDEPVLDLGCGGGRNARYLAREGYSVYGVDFSPLAVDFCRRVFERLGLSGNFYQSEIYLLPFPDNFFPAAVSISVLDHVTSATARKSLREMRRVLKPEGAVLLTFDPIDRIELFRGKAETLPDGTLKYLSGDNAGMIFRKYSDEEIIELTGQENLISFHKNEKGERIVVTR